jgi:hypothetical protein
LNTPMALPRGLFINNFISSAVKSFDFTSF